MTPERYQQVEKLYHAALALEPEQRPSWLAHACVADAELRAEVESLVKSEVAKAQSQMKQEFRAQLASFETQLNNDYQTRLQAVTSRVRSLETGKSRLIARDNRDESQIREWLADYRDTFGNTGNER